MAPKTQLPHAIDDDATLPQSFRIALSKSLEDRASWDFRVRRCSVSILAAVCFRETAISTSEARDSQIYQPIGFYYSLFHMSLAMLWIHPKINPDQLSNIRHTTLMNLVKNHLEGPGFLAGNYLDLMKDLRKLRETCNYRFGYHDELGEKLNSVAEATASAFEIAMRHIHQILMATDNLGTVQMGIADGFGDDILDTYLSAQRKQAVISYLVDRELTA